MKIFLAAQVPALVDAFRKYCGDFPGVTVYHGSILDLELDYLVSPANSFAFMDGGIDLLYTRRFGPELQRTAQAILQRRQVEEIRIGDCLCASTHCPKLPHVILAPTMRVPMVLPADTINPFLATRAAVGFVKDMTMKPDEKSIGFPGMGTGVGQVPYDKCARQMRAAFEEVLGEAKPFPRTLQEAWDRHYALTK